MQHGPLVKSRRAGTQLEIYEPARHRLKVAAAEFGIKEAKRIKDWPALEAAIDAKIEEQQKFVAWWKGHVTDKGGRPSKNRAGISAQFSERDAERQTGMKHQRVSDLGKWLRKPKQYRAYLVGAEYRAAFLEGAGSQQNQQSLSNEHYTPAVYIEAARTVLGGIDVDPASCDEANTIVRAKHYFTAKNSGLKADWCGRVWLNPPYGDEAGAFIDRLDQQHRAGNITAAVVLVNAHCTDTKWFQSLWNGDALCFTDHRINFYGDDTRSGSTHGSVFVYFGPDRPGFIREFTRFGAIVGKIA